MTNKIVYPDYNNCLTNVACSVLKHFELSYKHNPLPVLDVYLEKKNYKNVLLLVYDGLGLDVLKKNLPADSFLRCHIKDKITSVFPSTTAAATTSLLSGLNPCEHGWVGYDVYFKDIDKNVSIFNNKVKDTDENAASYNVATTFLSYETIIDQINRQNKYQAYGLFPFGKNHYRDLEEMHQKIKEICVLDGKKYIYAYYNEPDHTLHHNGTTSSVTKQLIEKLDMTTERLVSDLTDTLVIILADHGHIDTKVINLELEYPDFTKLLHGNTSIEGRACAFWVKEENRRSFVKQFQNLFAKDFILMTKQEVLNQKLFGDGSEHSNFNASLGDYLAIGMGNRYFELHYYPDDMMTHHAGITEPEMIVPLIVIEKI